MKTLPRKHDHHHQILSISNPSNVNNDVYNYHNTLSNYGQLARRGLGGALWCFVLESVRRVMSCHASRSMGSFVFGGEVYTTYTIHYTVYCTRKCGGDLDLDCLYEFFCQNSQKQVGNLGGGFCVTEIWMRFRLYATHLCSCWPGTYLSIHRFQTL